MTASGSVVFRNHTLAGLNAEDLRVLSHDLRRCEVGRGEVLTRQGAAVSHVYFPETAHLANTVGFADGRSAEPFIMGEEGVSGLAACLVRKPCAWTVDVEMDGVVFQLPADALRQRAEQSAELRGSLLNVSYDYQAQAALAAGCAALHNATSRLAKVILVRSDRLQTSEIQLTQEELAQRLGLLRTTVNSSAGSLRDVGALSYSRGRIQILDRQRLVAAACECYRGSALHQGRGRRR